MSRLIDADAMAESLEHDVELDARALDSTDLVGPEREHVQFDKDCKQNCMWYLTEQPTIAAPRWHRVEDELPEIGKIVLVYDDWDRLSICQLDKHYRWLRQGGGWFDVPYVRYWMPIEPPKEGV